MARRRDLARFSQWCMWTNVIQYLRGVRWYGDDSGVNTLHSRLQYHNSITIEQVSAEETSKETGPQTAREDARGTAGGVVGAIVGEFGRAVT